MTRDILSEAREFYMPCILFRAIVFLSFLDSSTCFITMLTSPLVLGFNGALQRRVEFPSTLKVIFSNGVIILITMSSPFGSPADEG